MTPNAYYRYRQVSHAAWKNIESKVVELPLFEKDIWVNGVARSYKSLGGGKILVKTNHRADWNEFTAFEMPIEDFRKVLEEMQEQATKALAKAQKQSNSVAAALEGLKEGEG